MTSDNEFTPLLFARTLRLKVRAETYPWLNAAAVEVNEVFNYCNGSSFKAASLKRKGACLRFAGKSFRVFEKERLEGVNWQAGCFAQDAVGDWWLCLPVEVEAEDTIAPQEAVGIDLGVNAIAVTSDGKRLVAGRWTQGYAQKLASALRRGHKRQAKRIHRQAARRRADALHKFSTAVVDRYQKVAVGDVSSLKLARTRMAKSVLDSGWGMLKTFLDYKSQQAARMFEVVNEKSTSITCSACGALSGPRGVNGLTVRFWICCDCGESHDRDVNAARNILIGSRCRTSMSGTKLSSWLIPPSNAYRVREAVTETAWAAA